MFSKCHVKHLPAIVSDNKLVILDSNKGDKSKFMELWTRDGRNSFSNQECMAKEFWGVIPEFNLINKI